MTYKELVEKLQKGEALTQEEFAEFGKLTRPTERFNEVAGEKKTLESTIAERDAKIKELEADKLAFEQKAQDAFNEKFSELSGKYETIAQENASLKAANAKFERMRDVSHIASTVCKEVAGAMFKDAEYLDVLLERKGVDITNKDAVKTAIEQIKAEKPEQFLVSVQSGSGTGTEPPNGGTGNNGKPQFFKTAEEKVEYIAKNGFEAAKDIPIQQGGN